MFGLIQSGAVPLKQDGTLDLDTAYTRAIRANDEVYELYKEEEAEKAQQQALKEQKAKQDKLNKSRAAGVSLKSAAPTGSLNGAQLKAKGVPGAVIGAIARSKGAGPGQKNYRGK